MSSDKNHPEAPSPRRPAPLITVAPVEVNSLGLGRGSALSPGFPSTPTSTLGGPAVRQSPGGHAVVTFTDAGSLSLASPLQVPSEGMRSDHGSASPPSQPHPILRCNEEMIFLSDEIYRMVEGSRAATSVGRWRVVIPRVASLDGMLAYLGGLQPSPHSLGSAQLVFEYYIREMCHELVDSATDPILVHLITRSQAILCNAWAEVVAPYLQATPSTDRRPRVSLPIPSPSLDFSGYISEAPYNGTSSPTATAAQADSVPDLDASPGEVQTQAGHPSTHTNERVDSQDLDFSSPDGTQAVGEVTAGQLQDAELPNEAVDGAPFKIRVSLDSLKNGMASINEELHHIAVSGKSKEAAPRIGYLKRAQKRMQLAARVLASAFGGRSSRSPSPEVERKRVLATAENPLNDAIPSSRPFSDASSFWYTAPYTPAPPGTKATIIPSASSGRFRLTGIVPCMPPTPASGTLAPSGDPSFLATTTGPPTPSIIIPPYATSPNADIVHRIRAYASEAEIVDPARWPALFNRIVGPCDFSSNSSIPDSDAPSTSAHIPQITIACVNQHHRDSNLPCTHSIVIPPNLELSSLLRQLAVSQGIRISELMAIVAGVSLGGQQASSTLGASSSTMSTPGPTSTSAPGQAAATDISAGTSNDQDNAGGVDVKGKARGPM